MFVLNMISIQSMTFQAMTIYSNLQKPSKDGGNPINATLDPIIETPSEQQTTLSPPASEKP